MYGLVFISKAGKSIFFFSEDKYSLNEFGNPIQFDKLNIAVFKAWYFMDLKSKVRIFWTV